jgi:hypothetical protein
VKLSLKEVSSFKPRRAGYAITGSPTNINVSRTMRQSYGRRIALRRPKQHELDAVGRRELDLRELALRQHAVVDLGVAREVPVVLLDHRAPHPRGEPMVDVVATQREVARVRDQNRNAGRAVHDGAVERAAAEVVDERALAARAARDVGVRGGERLFEQAHHAEPRILGGCDRGLALRRGERGGHRHGDG